MDSSQPERWLTVPEIATHLGVAPITIYRWLERGKIPAHRLGKMWRFRPSEVDQWVASGGAASDDVSDQGNPPEVTRG